MASYTITSEMAGYDSNRRRLRVLFSAGFFCAFQILFQVIWPSAMKLGLLWGIVSAVLSGIIFAVLFDYMFARRVFPYSLLVSDGSITAVHPSFERSVQRDNIRTVSETS